MAEVPALLVFVFFFFLQLALYPVNSALLVDSAHPSFCVPSSFYWLDLWQLFAGCLNGFRQLLELVWTPEALTKSTLYPGPTGMGSSIITREADLEVPSGNRKHKLDAHQKRITKKSFKCNSSHSFSKGAPTQMPPLSQDTTWDTNQLRRKHVGQFVLLSLDNDTSSCMLMHLRGEQRLRSTANMELWAPRRSGVCNDPGRQSHQRHGSAS